MTRSIAAAVAALFVVPLMQVGVTAAASERSGAGSSEAALRGRVVIECDGVQENAPSGSTSRALHRLGVITDRGTFFDDDFLRNNPHVRTFVGAKGTIQMSVYRERRGHWTIIKGTKAYAGLRGRGRESSTGPCPGPVGPVGCAISLTMTGTVSQSPISAANKAFEEGARPPSGIHEGTPVRSFRKRTLHRIRRDH